MRAPAGTFRSHDQTGAGPPQATITLSRPRWGRDGLRAYRVVVDSRPVAKLRQGRTCAIPVAPGRHRLYLRLDWWLRCPEVQVNLGPRVGAEFICRARGGTMDGIDLVESNPGAYLELLRVR